MTKQAAQDGEAGTGGYFPQENEPKSPQPHPIEGAVERLEAWKDNWRSVSPNDHAADLRTLLSSYKERGEELDDARVMLRLADKVAPALDRCSRASGVVKPLWDRFRETLADYTRARAALSPNPEAGG